MTGDDTNTVDDELDRINTLAVRALERLHDVEDQLEDAQRRLAELEEVVDPDPGSTEYANLTKAQKVFRVRKVLLRMALSSNGRSKMHYDEVRALFDGHASPGHCYDLMERAGEMEGYGYDESGVGGDGQKRVRCDASRVTDQAVIRRAKKEAGEGAA